MKRHGRLKGLPQTSLATFKSTGVSLLVAVNHQEERAVAVLGCLVQQEKGTVKHAHILRGVSYRFGKAQHQDV